MRWLTQLQDTLHSLLRRERAAAEFEQEFRDHLEQEIEATCAPG
jgi:hypothetical protein